MTPTPLQNAELDRQVGHGFLLPLLAPPLPTTEMPVLTSVLPAPPTVAPPEPPMPLEPSAKVSWTTRVSPARFGVGRSRGEPPGDIFVTAMRICVDEKPGGIAHKRASLLAPTKTGERPLKSELFATQSVSNRKRRTASEEVARGVAG